MTYFLEKKKTKNKQQQQQQQQKLPNPKTKKKKTKLFVWLNSCTIWRLLIPLELNVFIRFQIVFLPVCLILVKFVCSTSLTMV